MPYEGAIEGMTYTSRKEAIQHAKRTLALAEAAVVVARHREADLLKQIKALTDDLAEQKAEFKGVLADAGQIGCSTVKDSDVILGSNGSL